MGEPTPPASLSTFSIPSVTIYKLSASYSQWPSVTSQVLYVCSAAVVSGHMCMSVFDPTPSSVSLKSTGVTPLTPHPLPGLGLPDAVPTEQLHRQEQKVSPTLILGFPAC